MEDEVESVLNSVGNDRNKTTSRVTPTDSTSARNSEKASARSTFSNTTKSARIDNAPSSTYRTVEQTKEMNTMASKVNNFQDDHQPSNISVRNMYAEPQETHSGCRAFCSWLVSYCCCRRDPKGMIKVNMRLCDLDNEDIEELMTISVFTEKELKILRVRFLMLSDGAETIHLEKILELPEFCQNPLKERLLTCFEDVDEDGMISFREFVSGLNILAPQGVRDKKLLLAFKIHDYDGDERISKEDLRKYLLSVTRIHMTEKIIQGQKLLEQKEKEAGIADTKEALLEYNNLQQKTLTNAQAREMNLSFHELEAMYILRVRILERDGVLDTMVEHTFQEISGDGKHITRDEFIQTLSHTDYYSKLIINLCERVKIVK